MKLPEPRKLASGNYFIQLRLGGESIPVTAATAKECRDKARVIKSQHIVEGRAQRASGRNKTLTKAIDDYVAARNNTLSPATIRGYRTIQRNRFKEVMNTPIKNIKNWQEICNSEARIIGPKTLRNAYGFIVSALSENGIDPPEITLPQIAKNERPWLDYEEILSFVDVIKGEKGELPALLALSSLRRSEICALAPSNIDLKRNIIIVRGAKVPDEDHQYVIKSTNKNQKSQRSVPILIPRLTELLSASLDTDYLVTARPDTLRNQINRACKKGELPEVGVHGLRHSFASLAYHLGMPEKECMRIGGWADAKTMHDIYTHLAERDSQKYADAMREFYKNANENANETKTTA